MLQDSLAKIGVNRELHVYAAVVKRHTRRSRLMSFDQRHNPGKNDTQEET